MPAETTTGKSDTTANGGTTVTTAFKGSLTAVSTKPTEYRYLKAVRIGRHDGFDRIVFEFENGVPGYSVTYVERPITQDGSGDEVTVGGGAVLQVRMEAASGADLTSGTVRETYTGPERVAGAGGAIVEAVRNGDFEAVLNWAVGVTTKAPFKAYASEGNKLIIDVGQ